MTALVTLVASSVSSQQRVRRCDQIWISAVLKRNKFDWPLSFFFPSSVPKTVMFLPLACAAGAFLLWPIGTTGVLRTGELATPGAVSFRTRRASPFRALNVTTRTPEYEQPGKVFGAVEFSQEDLTAPAQSFVEAAPDSAEVNDLRHQVTSGGVVLLRIQGLNRTLKNSRRNAPSRAKAEAELQRLRAERKEQRERLEEVIKNATSKTAKKGHPEHATVKKLVEEARNIQKKIDELLGKAPK